VKPQIQLSHETIDRCWDFAKRAVAGYAAGRKTTALSMDGAERNVKLWAHSRMGECAFAQWTGQSIDALDWSDYPDDDSDIDFESLRVDVKATQPHCRYLIWPLSKNDMFATKDFDLLVLVKGNLDGLFSIAGLIEKENFAAHHHIAVEPIANKVSTWTGLWPGTWYMDEEELVPPYLIFACVEALKELVHG